MWRGFGELIEKEKRRNGTKFWKRSKFVHVKKAASTNGSQ